MPSRTYSSSSTTNTLATSSPSAPSFVFTRAGRPLSSASYAEQHSFSCYPSHDSDYIIAMSNDPKFSVHHHHSLYSSRPINQPSPLHNYNRPQHTRSLTVSTTASISSSSSSDSDMATTEITSPGSPPELSSSRSSNKSSSLRSSSLPGEDDQDMTHFEDISLSEVKRITSPSPLDRPNKPKQLLRTSTTPVSTRNQHSRRPSDGLRKSVNVKNGMRNLQEQRSPVNGHRPSLMVPPPHHRRRNGSPGRPLSTSPRSTTSPILLRTQTDIGPTLPLRRSPSQQGRRKSAKEIEAEFDALEDAEDEVPDDAIMTNIPISPRPQNTRSPSASPDREPSPPKSAGVLEFGRARSWDNALSGLTHEVRDLTMKLESHADLLSRRNSADQTIPKLVSANPPKPGLHHSKSATWSVPPVQKGDPLVDPLPASKEKEKHLTRTRPSWLPPKSKREEKKHMKEYKQMMDSFVEAEKRRSREAEKVKSPSSSKEKERDEALRAWREILGDWDASMRNSKTRDRWWAGIPPALRGQAWARAIGNDLHLTAGSFRAALSRAKATEQRLADTPNSASRSARVRQASVSETKADTRARRSLAALERDIAAAFPSLNLFQAGQPRHENLRELLLAYAAYREDTGHVKGTAGIAALLLLQHMPVSTPDNGITSPSSAVGSPTRIEDRDREVFEAATAGAFIAFANLLNKPLSLNFCINDAVAKERTVKHVERALRVKCPRLVDHFDTLSPESSDPATETLKDVVTPLAQSLLTNVLTSNEAARLLDVLVFEGDGIVVRAIVGILGRCEGSLYGSKEDVLSVVGWGGTCVPGKSEQEWADWIRWAGREDAVPPR